MQFVVNVSIWLRYLTSDLTLFGCCLLGSIAEREHMKWRNAVELPNNPYSAEALQRRLSQTSTTKFMDIERLAGKFDANIESKPLTTPSQTEKPIKVVLGANRVNPKRFVYHLKYLIGHVPLPTTWLKCNC